VGTDAWRFSGEIVLLVEDGCVEAQIGTEKYVLETGDSIHFDPSVEHRRVAGRGKPATLTCVIMIPPRLQADLVSRLAAATSDGSQPASIDAAPDAGAELQ